jgi:hypothetical protein
VKRRLQPPRSEERLPRFDTPNILWFFGAIATAYASNAVIAKVSSSDRGVWIFLVALLLAAVYAALAIVLRASRWWIPGGLFATIVVTLVPAIGVGFERLIGVGPGADSGTGTTVVYGTAAPTYSSGSGFSGSIFVLGLLTIAAGAVVYSLTRFDFVLAVVALAIVFTALLFVPAVVDQTTGTDTAATLIAVGAVLVWIGLMLDARRKRRAAFWWHTVGLGSIALALVYFIGAGDEKAAWAAMLALGILVLLLAMPFGRATWGVYGVAGAYAPLVHYIASGAGGWRLPLVLVFVSLSLLVLGVALHLHGDTWTARARTRLGL